ncbi:MAG: FAD-dependent oxidoreductase [Deltaproteobacteria bacterium]|nr:FAD-dependent oxidoreductase [Deltaproteobacteria bacterium]MBW2130031.1 FAD-dependent oxidoreductase [Deltaproteobacteria bacterium]MBW2303277.1 FAD-dependent oxidoreductase [Deltaproteobacteria bacterium]
MKFLIIGGDAAGMSAASRAKRNRPEMEVTVLEQTMDVSYSACGMPYNIADPGREIDDLVVRQARVFREKQGIDLRTGHRAVALDPAGKTVACVGAEGQELELRYDKLLIATGASPILPDRPGFDSPGVFTLKSLEHGRRIKGYIREQEVKRAVIIGMGYIALEMCESLRANGIEVDMVKPRPVFLPWMNRKLAETVKEEVEANGAGIHAGHEILQIEKTASGLKVLCPDLELEGQMVLVAVGVKPNSGLAEEAGLKLGPHRSIAVDRSLRTSNEDIYAAGDCADAFHVVTGERVWIPLALRANRAGWAVADNVAGKDVKLQGVVGTAVFKVFGLQVARTGLSVAEAAKAGFDPVEIVITARSRAHAHPGNTPLGVQMVGDGKTGRLLGVQMVGREGAAHRINAPAVALHKGMTVEEFSQCDLAYAPPFSPVWDPMLTAANQLLKRL